MGKVWIKDDAYIYLDSWCWEVAAGFNWHLGMKHTCISSRPRPSPEAWDGAEGAGVVAALRHSQVRGVLGRQAVAVPLGAEGDGRLSNLRRGNRHEEGHAEIWVVRLNKACWGVRWYRSHSGRTATVASPTCHTTQVSISNSGEHVHVYSYLLQHVQ